MLSGAAVVWCIQIYYKPPRLEWELIICCVLSAGFWGSVLGYQILEPNSLRRAAEAAIRGLAIAVLSIVTGFLIFGLIISVMTLDPTMFAFSLMIIIVHFSGQIWPAFPIGIISGWLLYQLRQTLIRS